MSNNQLKKWVVIALVVITSLGLLMLWRLVRPREGREGDGNLGCPTKPDSVTIHTQDWNSRERQETFDLPENEGSSTDEMAMQKPDEDRRAVDVEELVSGLRSQDPAVKIEAAKAVVERPTEHLVQVLLSETSVCEDLKTRREMLDAIGLLDANECPNALVGVLGIRKDGDIERAARKALIASSTRRVAAALVEYGEKNEADEYLLRDIGRTLALLNNPTAVDELLTRLDSENFTLFVGCAAALGNIGSEAAIEGLRSHLGRGNDLRDQVLREALLRCSAK